MAPKILEVIPGGRIQITGNFTKEEVERFVILINTSSYPVPVRINAVGKVYSGGHAPAVRIKRRML